LTQKQKAYIALVITSIVWGTTWVAMKLGVKGMPALQLAAIRQLLGGVIFLSFFTFIKKTPLPTFKQLKQLFFLSIFTFVLANGFSTWSLKYIASGLGALIGALYPLCVVLIGFFFYKKKNITKLSIAGILIGFIGLVVVLYENAIGAHSNNYFFGILLSFIAMISWSYNTIVMSQEKIEVNPYLGLGWQMIFGSIMMLIIAYASKEVVPISSIPATTWWAIFYLITAGSILAFIAFIYSMKHLPTSIATLYAYINPIVAIGIGSFMLNEHITAKLIIGSLITLAGVYLVNYANKKEKLQ